MNVVKRPCIDCGTPTDNTRCPAHHGPTKGQRYGRQWQQHSRAAIASHLATFGAHCPGYATDPHPCQANDLTCDHDLGVMCRSCNSRKGATTDKWG